MRKFDDFIRERIQSEAVDNWVGGPKAKEIKTKLIALLRHYAPIDRKTIRVEPRKIGHRNGFVVYFQLDVEKREGQSMSPGIRTDVAIDESRGELMLMSVIGPDGKDLKKALPQTYFKTFEELADKLGALASEARAELIET